MDVNGVSEVVLLLGRLKVKKKLLLALILQHNSLSFTGNILNGVIKWTKRMETDQELGRVLI